MAEALCAGCGHPKDIHAAEGGCAFQPEGERPCVCTGFIDGLSAGPMVIPMNRVERLIDLAQRLGVEPLPPGDGKTVAIVMRSSGPAYALEDIILAIADRAGL
jgi:hypothetical protein